MDPRFFIEKMGAPGAPTKAPREVPRDALRAEAAERDSSSTSSSSEGRLARLVIAADAKRAANATRQSYSKNL